jgi:hypothetical protein
MKYLIRTVIVIVAIFVLAIAGLFLYLTDERLKELVVPQANEALGREIQLDNISFTLVRTFPNFGLALSGLSVPDDSGDAVVSLDQLLVSIRLMPLLNGNVEVTRLDVIRADLAYVVFPDGSTNIDFLFDEEDVPAAESTSTIDLNRVRVVDSNIRYLDFQSDTQAELMGLNMSMSIRLAETIETDVDATLGGLTFTQKGTKMLSGLVLKLVQTSELDMENEKLSISDATLNIRGLELDMSGEISNWSGEFLNLDLSLASKSDNFGALLELIPDAYKSELQGITTRGSLQLEAKILGVLGENQLPDFNLILAVQNGYMKHPKADEPVEDIQINLVAHNNRVEISNFKAKANVNTVEMKGIINQPLSDDPSFDMSGIISLDLGTIETFYPISDQGIALRGKLDVRAEGKGVFSDVENALFNADLELANGYLRYLEVPQAIEGINIRLNATPRRMEIASFEAKSVQNTLTMSGLITEPLDSNRIGYDLKANALFDLTTIKEFYPIDEDTLMVRGQFAFDGTARGRVSTPDQAIINGTMTLQNGYVKHKSIARPIEDISLDSRLTATEFQIRRMAMKSGTNTFEGDGRVRNYLKPVPELDVKFKASLNLAEIEDFYSMEEIMVALTGQATMDLALRGPIDDFNKIRFNGGVQVRDVTVLGDSLPAPVTRLTGNMTFSDMDVQLRNFTMMMGSSDYVLEGRLVNWRNLFEPSGTVAPATLNATYRAKKLNIDEYVDWEEENEEPLVVELPNLKSQLAANIDSLIIMGIPITNISGQGETDPRFLRISSAKATMFGGAATGRFEWEIYEPKYTFMHFSGRLENVQAQDFFKEFQMGGKSKLSEYITGSFTTQVNYKSGVDALFNQDTPTIVANGDFGIARARLSGHPTQNVISDLLRSPELKDLSLDSWTALFSINDGILTLSNMNITSKDIGLVMNGNQNLIEDQLNYKIRLRLPERYGARLAAIVTAETVTALTQPDGIIILPLALVGTSEQPRVTIDTEVVQSIVTEYLRRRGTEQVEDAARRLLRGIRGN